MFWLRSTCRESSRMPPRCKSLTRALATWLPLLPLTIVAIVAQIAKCHPSHPTGPKPQNLLLFQQQQVAPEFTEPIGNHTVPLGRDAQLSCKISNLGPYRTAWLRVEDKGILAIHNNVITRNYRFGLLNTDNDQNFVLTIKNVQPADKGGYMCQINSVPMKSAVGYLDVLTPPVFDHERLPDEGEPPSGDQSPAATTSAPNSPLGELDDATSGQQQNSSQTTVVEGAGATLACRASGHPAPSITWRREDGRPIQLSGLGSGGRGGGDDDDSPTEIRDSSTLTFKAAGRGSSGAYLCIASNGVQPSASKRLLLDVQYAPVVTLPLTEVGAQLGQREARLECLVELNPLGTYHWIKLATSTTNTDRRPMAANQEDDLWLIEHDELIQSDKFDLVMRQLNSEKVHMTLTIRQVDKHDFSWYKCIAKNALGLQSNFIRFYESSAPNAPPTTQAPSSFSFSNIFRTSGDGAPSQPQHPPEDKLNLPQNDEAARQAAAAAASHHQARAHSRSSWIQRSTGSTASSAAGSSSGAPTALGWLAATSRPPASKWPSSLFLARPDNLFMFLCVRALSCQLAVSLLDTIAPYLIGITAVPLAATGALLTRSAQQATLTLHPT